MLKVIDKHLCDYAFIAEGGKLSLIGIFDHFFSAKFPLVVQPFNIVGIFEGEKGSEAKVKVNILDPEDKSIFNAEGPVKIGPNGKINLNIGIAGLKIEKPGMYKVTFTDEKKELSRIELPALETLQK